MSNELKFCLSRKDYIPPGGFKCKCPTTEDIISGADFLDLVEKCNKHIVEKGNVPPPNLAAEVSSSICERLPGYTHCKPCDRVKQTIGFMSIVRWVKAMYEFSKDGFQLVEQEEADRRASICAKCPFQIETAGCWGCKGIAGLVPLIAGAKTTPYDPQLKACGVCGCYNAVAVHLPTNKQGSEGLTFPEWCWKK